MEETVPGDCRVMDAVAVVYDFDHAPDRRGTGAMKYDHLELLYGSKELTPMWIADMEWAVAPEITDALLDRFSHPVYGYAAVPDSFWASITEWLGHRHGLEVKREELSFVAGIVRGLGYAINYFSRPGDGIVIQPPVYHPFRHLTEENGRRVLANPLRRTGAGYEMDLETLESIFVNEHPRLMILCNPHNPGGVQWDAETLRKVASLARKHGVTVLSDEIHGDLMLFGTRHVPFASVSDDAAAVSVTFGAPSKTFNIAGLAGSWMYIPNPELREGFFKWMEVNEFSVPTFAVTTGVEAAYRHGEPWLDAALGYLEGTVKVVEEWFAAHLPQVHPMRPEASFLIWLDCRALKLEQPELVNRFIKAGLALNDGSMFGTEGNGYMRLNIGMPRAQVLAALEPLAQVLTQD